MDPDHSSNPSSRPGAPQHNSSSTILNARTGHHQVSGRGPLKNRNASHSKNLNKLAKQAAGVAGAKVALVTNTSRTNLRKNQSETALQQRQRIKPSSSSVKSHREDEVPRRSSDTDGVTMQPPDEQYRTASGSFIPEINPILSYTASRAQMPPPKSKGRKRSSKDHGKGKNKRGERSFDFDGDEKFDDDVWEDERSEQDMDEPSESKGVPIAESNARTIRYDLPLPEPTEDRLDQNLGDDEKQLAEDTKNKFTVEVRDGSNPPTAVNVTQQVKFHIDEKGGPNADESHSNANDGRERGHEKSNVRFIDNATATGSNAASHPTYTEPRSPYGAQSGSGEDSDSDSSPDTVVLAPSTRKPAASSLKPSRASVPEPTLSTDTSPILTMKSAKKVQIEEPQDDMDAITRSMSGDGIMLPPTAVGTVKSHSEQRSTPQYEFLSKAQRDRASLTQEPHPYPPSAWRDQYLVRAVPHIHELHDDYTRKFQRRLDRRIDSRLNTLLETRDPLLEALHKLQHKGLIHNPADDSTMPEPARPAGIQAWFSRLGGGARKEEQRPQTQEEADSARVERWGAMLERHEWRLGQEDSDRTDRVKFADENDN